MSILLRLVRGYICNELSTSGSSDADCYKTADFRVSSCGVTLKVRLIADKEMERYASDPGFFAFCVLDCSTQVTERKWVVLSREALAAQLNCEDLSVATKFLGEHLLELPKFQSGLCYSYNVGRFMEALRKPTLLKGFRLLDNFDRKDADYLLGYVAQMISAWKAEESDGVWQKQGELREWKLVKRRNVSVRVILPRSLVVLRTTHMNQKGDYSHRLLNVWVLFNRSFRERKGCQRTFYEGLVGNGSDNVVKLAFELFEGRWAAFRRTREVNFDKEESRREAEINDILPGGIALKQYLDGWYVSKDGFDRHIGIFPLYYSDLHGHAPQDLLLRLKVALKCVSAVHSMHMNGVAHRDLKPDAFLISENYSDVKLSDFGRSVVIGQERESFRCGTPEYLFPFCTPGSVLTDDRFGLGLILFSIFDLELKLVDECHLKCSEYVKMMSRLREKSFSQMNYEVYFAAVRRKIGDNWIVEPPVNTLEYIVWSLLRADLMDFEGDKDYLTTVMERLKGLLDQEDRTPA